MREKLIVNNIKCRGCEASVRDSLSKIDGVENILVDAATGEVEFDCSSETSLENVRLALHKMGYTENDPSLIDTAKSYVSCMMGKMKWPMDLKDKIGFGFILSIFSLVIAGLFPSRYSLTFSAVVTTIAIISIAFYILKDNSNLKN